MKISNKQKWKLTAYSVLIIFITMTIIEFRLREDLRLALLAMLGFSSYYFASSILKYIKK
jgi:hypothetical protein